MQALFDFYPSEIKPLSEFFANSERCTIIRHHNGTGYFVATYETHKKLQRWVPMAYRRMWWVKTIPTRLKRLKGRRYHFCEAKDPANICHIL